MDGIGSTEMLHIFISAGGNKIRPGATGQVVPGYVAEVQDASGNPVADGEFGRLAVKGPTGCRYLGGDRQNAYVQAGWNLTGDTFVRDADGYFWFQARADDMIISSGYNIAGPEVENALLQHPDVAEVVVVGFPDPARGTIVKAFVVPKPGVARTDQTIKTLQDFVKAQIAPYKYPRAITFVDSLPRTSTGKVQRFQLRRGGP
jgi:2-aminobenzoate-CoA ligase